MLDDRNDWPRLLSLLVHELRTPVNVAGGYLKMLLDPRTGRLEERQRQMVEHASRSVDGITALLADASELARLERGEGRRSTRRGDLVAITRASAAAFVPPHESQVRVEVRAAIAAAPIEADIERLQRAIGSCLTALAREAPANGRLVVDLAEGADNSFVLVIADEQLVQPPGVDRNGWGPLDDLRGGLGLELPLARRVVTLAGGRLESPSLGRRQPAVRLVLPRAR